MSNNVCGSAHPSGAPFICLDITPGHACLVEEKKRLLCRVALRLRMGHVVAFTLNKIDSGLCKTDPQNPNNLFQSCIDQYLTLLCICMLIKCTIDMNMETSV